MWASAADLVEFMGPGTDYGAVLVRAAVVAQDASQLGFSSKSVPDDRSGEFSIDVFDDAVQVAVLSDDGVNVQVTDLGDINDPLGTEPQSLPGLNNLGTGQDLPTLGQSLKLIPGTLSANRRYHFEWQYRNTIHTSDNDIDGMKVFVLGGGAQLALAPAKNVKLSPLNKDGKEWNEGVVITPRHDSLQFAGSLVTLELLFPDEDSVRGLDDKFLLPIRPNPNKKGIAELKIKNADFLEGGVKKKEITTPLTVVDSFLRANPVFVQIPDTWGGDVEITYKVVDVFEDAERAQLINFYKRRGWIVDPATTVTDTMINDSVTWKGAANKSLPTSVEGIYQEWTPNLIRLDPMWTKQETRLMLVTYQYGPRTGNTALYTGLPVQEVFTPWATGLTDLNLIDSTVRTTIEARFVKQGRDMTKKIPFDDYANDFLNTAFLAGVSTFIIDSVPNGPKAGTPDCTRDTYAVIYPEMLRPFFKQPPPSSLTLTSTQKYFCGKTELTGDMPRTVTASYTTVGSGLKKEQQVSK